MRRNGFLCLIVMMAAFMACSKSNEEQNQDEEMLVIGRYEAVGDSMFYGLACDGCSDSVLVLLPDDPEQLEHLLKGVLAQYLRVFVKSA